MLRHRRRRPCGGDEFSRGIDRHPIGTRRRRFRHRPSSSRRRRTRRTRRKRGGGESSVRGRYPRTRTTMDARFLPPPLPGRRLTGEGGGGGSKKRTGITRGPPKKEGGKVEHSLTAPPRIPKHANDDLTPPGTPVIAIACRPACSLQSFAHVLDRSLSRPIVTKPLPKFIDGRREAMNQKKNKTKRLTSKD